MSGLDNLALRLAGMGGSQQIDRMNLDKLKSLKKALWYSYQSATAKLNDGREFRCLINPDKLKNQYDDKIISIPFEDICLNNEDLETQGKIETIGLKPGDVFTWKENETDWLVFLRRLEETAYFRAEIRRCKYTVTIGESEYKCYVARPEVNEIDWLFQKKIPWNDIDYTLQMYITKDETTLENIHRFTILKINNQPWEVQSIDSMSSDGIIIVYLKEWYNNSIEDAAAADESSIPVEEDDEDISAIIGPTAVYPYETKSYTIKNAENGTWEIDSQKAKILYQNSDMVTIQITSGRSGVFELKYKRENEEDIILKINIDSL